MAKDDCKLCIITTNTDKAKYKEAAKIVNLSMAEWIRQTLSNVADNAIAEHKSNKAWDEAIGTGYES